MTIDEIRQVILDNIRTNGVGAITGIILQTVLLDMLAAVQDGNIEAGENINFTTDSGTGKSLINLDDDIRIKSIINKGNDVTALTLHDGASNSNNFELGGTNNVISPTGSNNIAIGSNNEIPGGHAVTVIGDGNTDFTGVFQFVYGTGNNGSNNVGSVTFGNFNTNTGSFGFCSGCSNVASGGFSTAIGTRCQALGQSSIAIGSGQDDGKQLVSNGMFSVAIGGSTTGRSKAVGDGAVSIGMDNIANAQGTVAIGHSNTSLNQYNATIGYNNTNAAGNDGAIFGTSNSIHSGEKSIALGFSNSSIGDGNNIIGWNNSASTLSNNLFGMENTVTAANCTVVGKVNTASTESTYMYGFGLVSNQAYANGNLASIIVGRYNKVQDESIFTVGNGVNNANRANALRLNNAGDLFIQGGYQQMAETGVSPTAYTMNLLLVKSLQLLTMTGDTVITLIYNPDIILKYEVGQTKTNKMKFTNTAGVSKLLTFVSTIPTNNYGYHPVTLMPGQTIDIVIDVVKTSGASNIYWQIPENKFRGTSVQWAALTVNQQLGFTEAIIVD